MMVGPSSILFLPDHLYSNYRQPRPTAAILVPNHPTRRLRGPPLMLFSRPALALSGYVASASYINCTNYHRVRYD